MMCNFFKEHEYEEIAEFDILTINIKSFYRPFKDSNECFEEMSKHTPFGWVTASDKGSNWNINSYTQFNLISDNGVFGHDFYKTFEMCFEDYKFVDGTPFGVKEE